MPDLDRIVGGLRCRDVLSLLADFVDGDLDSSVQQQVTAHLHGCDTCEKFGGEYEVLVRALRAGVDGSPVDPGVKARLAARLRDEWRGDRSATDPRT